MVVPCITMVGTFPKFYVVPVRAQLSESVVMGRYPADKTAVLRYIPDTRRESESMNFKARYSNAMRTSRCVLMTLKEL